MILDLKKIQEKDKNLSGQKALNLSILKNHNFKIPNGFVISTQIFDDFKTFGKIQNLKEIKETFISYFGSEAKVIVRSSANFEDTKDASFAGIYESYLGVGIEDLEEKIEMVFNSIFSEKALSYYENNEIPRDKVKMAVIVQEQIRPLISGVCFTKNPVNQKNEIITEYVSGSNDKFVSGYETPKNIIYNYEFNLVSDTSDLENSNLIKDYLKDFLEIEKLFGSPQDIEWAIDNNKNLNILQARNIVFEKKVADEKILKEPIAHGIAMSSGIGRGKFKVINLDLNFSELENSITSEDIIYAHNLRVDQILAIKNASGIILGEASVLSHVAIQAREFGIPCVGGIINFKELHEGKEITIDGNNGTIYEGISEGNFETNIKASKFPTYFNIDLVKEYKEDNLHFLYSIIEGEAMVYLPNISKVEDFEKACEILNSKFKISPDNIHLNQIKMYEGKNSPSSVYSYFKDYQTMISDPKLKIVFDNAYQKLENIDTEGLKQIIDSSHNMSHDEFVKAYDLFQNFKETKEIKTLETLAEHMDNSLKIAALVSNVVIYTFGNYFLEKHLKEINGPTLLDLLQYENFSDPKVVKLKELSNILVKYKNAELEPLSQNGITFIDIMNYIYDNGFEEHVLKYQW